MNINNEYWPLNSDARSGQLVLLYLKKGQKIKGRYENRHTNKGPAGWYDEKNKPVGTFINPVVGWKAIPGRFKQEPLRNTSYQDYSETIDTNGDSFTRISLRVYDEVSQFDGDYSETAKKIAAVRALHVKRVRV